MLEHSNDSLAKKSWKRISATKILLLMYKAFFEPHYRHSYVVIRMYTREEGFPYYALLSASQNLFTYFYAYTSFAFVITHTYMLKCVCVFGVIISKRTFIYILCLIFVYNTPYRYIVRYIRMCRKLGVRGAIGATDLLYVGAIKGGWWNKESTVVL